MIIALRKSIKSRTFKIILWIVILAASGALSIFEFARSSFFGKTGMSWIFQVNGQKIYVPEFMRSVADQEERIRIMRAQYGQYADLYFQMMGMKMDPKELAANDLIRKALVNSVADKLPLYIDQESAQNQLNNPILISQEISDLVPFSTWDPSLGGINPLALQAYLQHVGVSSAEFNQQLVQAIKRSDVKKLVEHAAYTPEFELKEQFAKNYLGHKFSIAIISGQDILAHVKKEAVSDEKLKSYFDLKNNQEKRYYVSEKRSAKIVTFDPTNYGIAISDADVETYYNNNKAQYVEQPAQVQVRRILFKVADPAQEQMVKQKAETVQQELVKNPEAFAAKAKELSEDSKSAAQGGLLPYFSKGQQADKIFERTSFLLKEDGNISDVIRTGEGYEIVQRVGKKMQTFKPLAQVSKDIKDLLKKKKFAERFAGDVRAILAQPNSAQALAAFVQEKNGKESSVKDIAAGNSILAKTIFRLKDKETSFYQDVQQGVVVTVTEIKPIHLPSLEEIKSQVKEDYYKDEAAKKVAARIDEINNGAVAFDKLKDEAKIEKTGWLRHSQDFKDDQKEKNELTQKGVNLGKMFQIENKGGVIAYESNGNGIIIRLDDIAPFDKALFDEKKAELEEFKQQKKGLVMAGFVASLYRNAKINKNESQIRIES